MRSIRVFILCSLATLVVGCGLWMVFPPRLPSPSTFPINDNKACGFDFAARINEAECVKKGVNPFHVWHEDVIVPPYVSMLVIPEKISKEHYAQVAAYMPWEYALILPLCWLPMWFVWYMYLAICLLVLGCFCRKIFISCFREYNSAIDAMFGLLGVEMLIYPIWLDLFLGNYTILILGAIVVMCYCLNRNRNVLAGMMWAFVMVKPQYGLIFAVPFLMKRKILTIIIAVVTCVGLSLIPSLMCHTPIADLVLQVKDASMVAFRPCAVVPAFVVDVLARLGCSESVAVYLGLGLGATICTIFCWKLRFVKDWYAYMLPAVIMAVSWSYVLDHGYVLCILPVFLASLYYLKYGDNRYKLLFVLSLPFVCRFYNLVAMVGYMCNGLFPWLNFSKPVDNALNSYNSLIAMLFMLGFCMLLIRKRIDWLVEKPTEEQRLH